MVFLQHGAAENGLEQIRI